jgi:rubredoxin
MTDSKWKCPKCGSLEVQIALPAWHNEGVGHNLTYIQTDEDAEPLYWFCRACEESGDGEPAKGNV